MLKVGSHVSMKGKEMLLGAAQEAFQYDANVFMIYTGAPQNTRRKAIDELNIEAGQQFMQQNGLIEVVVHAPYIVNLANTTKPGYNEFAREFLREEIRRAEAIGAKQIVLHPGAHVGAGAQVGIQQIVDSLNDILRPDQTAKISLETMSGKGTEIGRTFEELAQIIEGVHLDDKLSVTFDTCHVHDAGYQLVDQYDEVFEEFDRVIGLERLQVLHINDSKNVVGAHKDRHENLGYGEIGFKTLNRLVNDPRFKDVPKILETPWIGEDKKNQKAPYYYEIKMLQHQTFNPNLHAHVMEV
ncbi:deoxyribonuclease IV [Atopobacter phocae]|uniref:deoxyribonuclease IV n=1 Tax=Atopobacter phocae TaxID=136492 RepID=UPI00046EA93D|nr:deoxyribonuclease IV [Atopobacter phocae]